MDSISLIMINVINILCFVINIIIICLVSVADTTRTLIG